MMTDIKRCPACGGIDLVLEEDPQIAIFWVECTDCFSEAEFADTAEEAIKNWNNEVNIHIIPRRVWWTIS